MDDKEHQYEPGNIVWVKLGPFWWPGEVVNKNDAPDDLIANLRKEPIAIVKFEDNYMECVLSHDEIYPYNCEKKSYFIKKGMNAFRTKNPKMESFPKDVTAAEIKTGGNANIISEEENLNERKRNYDQEIFGTPSSVKKPKHGSLKKKGRTSLSSNKFKPIITHRRFLGYDDFEVRILIQGDGKESAENEDALKCPSCTYSTDRLAMLTMHSKTHIKTKLVGSSLKKPVKRRKKTSLLSDDDDLTSDGEKKQKTKRKYRKKEKNVEQSTESNLEIVQKKSVETVADILANWDDDEDEDFEEENSELDVFVENKIESKDSSTNFDSSCFDFEDDDDAAIPETSSGRKIPRVIPEKEKTENDEEEKKIEEGDDENEKDEILKESQKLGTESLIESGNNEEDVSLENTYKTLMEETEDLKKLPDELVPEQNFHRAKAVKYPDKSGNLEKTTKDTPKSEKKSFPTSRRSLRSGKNENEKYDETIEDDLEKIQEISKKIDDEHEKTRRSTRKSRKFEEEEHEENVNFQNGSAKKLKKDTKSAENDEKTSGEQEELKTDLVKSKKGRPRKIQETKEEPEITVPEETEPKTKRGRGRKSHGETVAPSVVEETPKSKEKKAQNEQQVTEPTVQKENLRRSMRKRNELSESSGVPENQSDIENHVEKTKIKRGKSGKKDEVSTNSEEEKKVENEEKIEEKCPENEGKPPEIEEKAPETEVKIPENEEKMPEIKEKLSEVGEKFSEVEEKPSEVGEKSIEIEEVPARVEEKSPGNLENEKKIEPVRKTRKPSRWDQFEEKSEKQPSTPVVPLKEKRKSRWDQKENDESSTPPTDGGTVETSVKEPKSPSKEVQTNSIFDTPEKTEETPSKPAITEEKMATKLTNPKKRFVKSFEDFELNKTATVQEEPPTTKSPIVFKLKKQIITKISGNIFEEDENEKKTKPVLSKNENVEPPAQTTPPGTSLTHPTTPDKPEEKDDSKIEIITKNFPFDSEKVEEETEFVQIDGNLKVVSEKELAEGQIELTTTPKKMKTILNFSMDFSEEEEIVKKPDEKMSPLPTNSIEIVEKTEIEPEIDKTFEGTIKAQLGTNFACKTKRKEENHNITIEELLSSPKTEKPKSPIVNFTKMPKTTSSMIGMYDLEEHIPSQIVCTKNIEDDNVVVVAKTPTLQPVKSKLMTRLTKKPDEKVVKIETKSSIKTKPTTSSTNAIILSEKIIKPAKQQSESIGGKAKILNQTIIKPAVKQPETNLDEFDINSMPIVISDELLTAESLENMPIVIGENTSKMKKTTEVVVKKPQNNVNNAKILNKTIAFSISSPGGTNVKRTVQRTIPVNKSIKYTNLVTQNRGTTKYVAVKETTNQSPQLATKAFLKKLPFRKNSLVSGGTTTTPTTQSTGNKIMILTDEHGKQERFVIPPDKQKLFGLQKQIGGVVKKPMVQSKNLMTHQFVQKLVKTSASATSSVVSANTSNTTTVVRKLPKIQQRTILIRNQQGQVVRKTQSGSDPLLDKQVAEQIEAIKASNLKAQAMKSATVQSIVAHPRKSYGKKIETINAGGSNRNKLNEPEVPPLAPLKSEKADKTKNERPLNQLVIQDNLGNQTTVTEGQILALPSETVDGQPQSYMLVTLDESGNLTPLNNEALMSLDPNLAANLTSSTDLQLQDTNKEEVTTSCSTTGSDSGGTSEVVGKNEIVADATKDEGTIEQAQNIQVTLSGEPGQQIILTGDALATQKFLNSLSEGNTDLASILSGAEGNSFLIQADGQQILINTENEANNTNPVTKNQDILAAALADTDVFQEPVKTTPTTTQLSSQNQTLYPINVGNVLETSLTLNSPIMTAVEVPSSNNKKVIPDEEADILTTQVPKNIDLPITVTDPNITQTVSQQQQNQQTSILINSELNLSTIENSDSSSFVTYALDEKNQKSYGSMPLLEIDESTINSTKESILDRMEMKKNNKMSVTATVTATTTSTTILPDNGMMLTMSTNATDDGGFMDEGLCTLGGEMCSSLSEPPPEMFDIPNEHENMLIVSNDENSMEIPIQPQIVADLKETELVDGVETEDRR